MRRLTAAFLVLVLATLFAGDGLRCPDGCTDEPPATAAGSEHSEDSDSCLLCLASVDAPLQQAPTFHGFVVERPALVATLPAYTAPTDPIDHPPRS